MTRAKDVSEKIQSEILGSITLYDAVGQRHAIGFLNSFKTYLKKNFLKAMAEQKRVFSAKFHIQESQKNFSAMEWEIFFERDRAVSDEA